MRPPGALVAGAIAAAIATGALAVDPDADAPEVTPNLKVSLGLQYEYALGNSGTLIPRLDYYYQDDAEGLAGSTASPTAVVESYNTLNARLTWRSSGRTRTRRLSCWRRRRRSGRRWWIPG